MAKTDSKPLKNDTATPTSAAKADPRRAKPDAESTEPKFWHAMKKIGEADWGSRANIYLYRVEPITDRLRGGDKKYIMCYGEPISEDRVMIDQGSGRYKAILTFKKPASNTGDEVDAVYFDILNPKFPPKIPPGEWLDDPRNKKWAWAKQYAEPAAAPPPSQASSILESMQVLSEIRKNTIEETRQTAPATPAADPLVTALSIAKDFMTMRADNPMVTMMNEQMTALRAELAAQRVRSDALSDKLAEKNKDPEPKADATATIKTFFEGFKSLREQVADVLPASGGRSRGVPWWQETLIPSITRVLEPLVATMAQNAMQPNPAPVQATPQIHQTPGAASQPQAQDFGAFLHEITPRMLRFFDEYDNPAATFAEWFHEGYGDIAARAVDKITSLGGAPALLAWYRASKYWPALQPHEAEFTKFLADVIAWKPETEKQTAAPADASEAPVIDLAPEPQEAN